MSKPQSDFSKEIQQLLHNLTNGTYTGYMGERSAENDFFQALIHLHPTLQQTFFRILKQIIYTYAEFEFSDARNEASVEWCKRVADSTAKFVGLPVI